MIKPISYILFFSIIVIFQSCNKEELPQDDAKSQETLALRELYSKKIHGRWTATNETQCVFLAQDYNFLNDSVFEGHILLKTRDSVKVDGKNVFKEWVTIVDSEFDGTWDLRYLSSTGKNALCLRPKSDYAFNRSAEFLDVNDSVLEIQSPFFLSDTIKMHRAK